MGKLMVLHVQVGEEPKVVTVENELDSLKKLVGGYIEVVYITDDIVLVVNEEGLLEKLPVNFMVGTLDGLGEGVKGVAFNPMHQIHGNAFFVSTMGEDFASLDKIQIQEIKNMFGYSRNMLVVK